MKLSKRAIHGTIKNHEETGSGKARAGRGRMKITTLRVGRLISLKNRKTTSNLIKKMSYEMNMA